MDSDSDSGGSHISSTPPRKRSGPLHPTATPSVRLSSAVAGSSTRVSPFSCRSTPIWKPKSFSNPKLSKPKLSFNCPKPSKPKSPSDSLKPSNPKSSSGHPEPSKPISRSSQETSPSPMLSSLSAFPFPIRRSSDQCQAVLRDDFVQTLPAGHFSKSAFFSRLQRPCPPPESAENDTLWPLESVTQCEVESSGTAHIFPVDLVPSCSDNSVKVTRKHPNLIGGSNIQSMPMRRRKCASEGNFVKLNLNGYKQKFANRNRGKNFNSSGRRKTYRRFKKKVKAGHEGEMNGLCVEDVVALEEVQQLQERRKPKFDCELIEEAVLAVRNEASDENLVKLLKLTHGYDSFREGQLEAIKMVLSGISTMLVLRTGAGKSLCYQLPAIILPGLTLVVCPLVSLMIDQLKHLPPMVHGGLLSSSQTIEEATETLRLLQEGAIKVLFVSPERFLNTEFLSVFSNTQDISLIVVDEAHCISEWSHNFRPSYMRLRASLLRTRLNAECILAMTATATSRTLQTVMSALEIPKTNLIQRSYLRDNLELSVTTSENRMKDLLMLLKSSPFTELKSIIIYCKFQSETEFISKYLSDNNIPAKSYHSGIHAKERMRVQELFCSNKIRVVVATVAFGMGLDKSDIGAVIHHSLPESLEEYVQEIGRAGRDGRLSYCHLLSDDITYFKLRSLMHSDGVDEYAVSKFLFQIFSDGVDSRGKVCSLVKEPASRKFDMKEEVMLTLLTRLELGEVQYLRLLPQLNVGCTLNFHKTPPGFLAEKDTVVAAILKMSERKQGQYMFDIPSTANSIGITAVDILNRLQNLKLKAEITYVLKDPAFCYTIVEVPRDLCSLATHLTKWLSEVESCQVQKLDLMFNAATSSVKECKQQGCHGSCHTECLQQKIVDYFNRDDYQDVACKMAQSSRFLRADIKVFLQSNPQAKFTPRATARIMHGIASPAYPSATWSKCHFWGRYTQIDFYAVMEVAKSELLNSIGKDGSS